MSSQPEAYNTITGSTNFRCLGFDGRYLYLGFDTKLAGKIAKMTANNGDLPAQVGTIFTFADSNDSGTYLVFDDVYICAISPKGASSSR
jgi:hypothetical protein